MVCGPAWIWMVRQRRAVLTNLRMDQPAWRSIRRLTARAAKTMVRWASIESRVRWKTGRARRSLLAIRERLLDLEEPAVGADHELGRDLGAVRAGHEVGGISLEPGQGPRFGLEVAVYRMLAAGQGDEPVPLDRDDARDRFLGLGDLLIDPPQGPAAAVGAVPAVNGLVPAAGCFLRPGWRAMAG